MPSRNTIGAVALQCRISVTNRCGRAVAPVSASADRPTAKAPSHSSATAARKVPAHRELQNGSKLGVRSLVALDLLFWGDGQAGTLMRRQLKDDARKPQLKDDLQRCQAQQRVAVSLRDRREKVEDKQHGSHAAQDLAHPGEECLQNCAINPDRSLDRFEQPVTLQPTEGSLCPASPARRRRPSH